jgi:hypothetical protein
MGLSGGSPTDILQALAGLYKTPSKSAFRIKESDPERPEQADDTSARENSSPRFVNNN